MGRVLATAALSLSMGCAALSQRPNGTMRWAIAIGAANSACLVDPETQLIICEARGSGALTALVRALAEAERTKKNKSPHLKFELSP